jgi:hypothetical protein
MARKTSGPHGFSDKLHETIDGLRKDVTRVEVAKPVPGHGQNPKYELGQPVETGKLTENDDLEPARQARGGTSE